MESSVKASASEEKKLDQIYEKYIREKSLMIYLQQIQSEFGYVPGFAIKYISKKMNVAESHIYGVITFYAQFRTIPVGKHIVKICCGTACHVGGATILSETLNAYLNLGSLSDTTEDGLFTIQNVACLGCCALAPAMMINGKVYGKLDVNEVKRIIDSYRHGSAGQDKEREHVKD